MSMTGEPVNHQGARGIKPYEAPDADVIIPEMVRRIVAEFDPERIIPFGSHARGDANRWSDIDLLVVFEKVENNREMAVTIRRVLRDVPAPKDIVVADEEQLARYGDRIGTVYRPALREGKTLYERL